MKSEKSFYDHYKDSCEQLRRDLTKRDYFTIASLVMIALLCFQTYDGECFYNGINGYIERNIPEVRLKIIFLKTLISYVFLWIIISYYQICLTIENLYEYIHRLEGKLSESGKFKIEREGTHYLKSYPWVKWLVHKIYIIGVPSSLILLVGYNALMEWRNSTVSFFLFLLLAAYGLNIVMSLLYISSRLFNENVFTDKKYSGKNLFIKIRNYFK